MRVIGYLGVKPLICAAGLIGLAACEPQVPNSAAGIGDATSPFNSAPQRVAAGSTVTGDPLIQGAQISNEGRTPDNIVWRSTELETNTGARVSRTYDEATGSATDIANETAAALSASGGNSGVAPVNASPSNPAPQLLGAGNASISDENDFAAVASRESIASDAERLRQLSAQRVEVAPTALPQRDTVGSSVNIVEYALTTNNTYGQNLYRRIGINLENRSRKNCATFSSPELAQIAFLEAGGPLKDRKALDPDGDGYACTWDPRPIRASLRGPTIKN